VEDHGHGVACLAGGPGFDSLDSRLSRAGQPRAALNNTARCAVGARLKVNQQRAFCAVDSH
jgi:hypothetical protein